jgi:hypothetical protein
MKYQPFILIPIIAALRRRISPPVICSNAIPEKSMIAQILFREMQSEVAFFIFETAHHIPLP